MAVSTPNVSSDAAKYIYDATKATQTTAVANNSDMTMDDFWQLLAAQLKYQDMSNPMSNSEMMSQMTQMGSMSAMTQLSEAIASIATVTNNLSQVTLTGYSTGLLGKEVTIAITEKQKQADGSEKDVIVEEIKGVVTGVDLTGATSVYVNGKKYELSQIMAVGDVPKKEDGDKTDTDKTDNDKTDTDNETEGTDTDKNASA